MTAIVKFLQFNLMQIFLLFGLVSCVSVQPTTTVTSSPNNQVGYVAGAFTKINKGPGFGFVLVQEDTRSEYILPFGEDTTLPMEFTDQVVMIQVPPGNYKVAYWITYGTIGKDQITRKQTAEPLSRSFTVSPGSVVFLGHFAATVTNAYPRHIYSFNAKSVDQENARKAFTLKYPLFSQTPFSCPNCLGLQ